MTTRPNTVALVTGNTLVALDLTTTINELFPDANVMTLDPPLVSTDDLGPLSDLIALVIDQSQERALELDELRETGIAIVILGDAESERKQGVAYLQMPFTTEMVMSVLATVARPNLV